MNQLHLSRNMERRVAEMWTTDRHLKQNKLRDANDTSVQKFVDGLVPAGFGSRRAELRELEKAARLAVLYADTPQHPMTRQQRRHAAQKAA